MMMKMTVIINNTNIVGKDITNNKDIPSLNYEGQTDVTDPQQQAQILHKAMTNPKKPTINPKHVPWQNSIDNYINHYINTLNEVDLKNCSSYKEYYNSRFLSKIYLFNTYFFNFYNILI